MYESTIEGGNLVKENHLSLTAPDLKNCDFLNKPYFCIRRFYIAS